jgi:hypothetical protein
MDSDASTTLEKTPKNTKKHHEKTKTIVEKHQNEQAHDLRK